MLAGGALNDPGWFYLAAFGSVPSFRVPPFWWFQTETKTRSPSSTLLPFFGARVPLLK